MQRIIIILILSVFINSAAFSQNTGFAGKRFNLKLDLWTKTQDLNIGFGVEYIALKNTTFSIGYNSFKNSEVQDYSHLATPTNVVLKIQDLASIKTQSVYFELRQFFNSSLKPNAPRGLFTYFQFRPSMSDIEGNYYRSFMLGLESITPQFDYIDYSYKNLRYNIAEIGVGYQFLITDFINLGFRIGYDYVSFNYELNDLPSKVVSGVTRNLGPNLFTHGFSSKEKANSCSGMSLFFQLGILKF